MAHCITPKIPFSDRRTFTLGETAAMTGLCVATLYNEMQRGRLKTIKLAGRRLVTREAVDEYIAAAGRDTGQSDGASG
jgi:predicted DNA-binding transcriptional regulator AlpA